MGEIDSGILNIDKVICSNIAKFEITERGLLSQNILQQLRNFVEHVSLKAYRQSLGYDIKVTYTNIEKANDYVKSRGDLKFLSKFHKLLQVSTSHYTVDEENSERLMLKYYEHLLKIKSYLKTVHNIDVLENISKFPLNKNSTLSEYYKKIVTQIKQSKYLRGKSSYNERYYIQKIKPFFVGYEIFYEVTFTTANDKASKFDRIIAFTQYDILPNYAVKLRISNNNIQVLGKNMPIQIINGWEVSIRPCELSNFGKIFGIHHKSWGNEYSELMRYLTTTGINLTEVIDFSEKYYHSIKRSIIEKTKVSHFFKILDLCRQITKNNLPGSNVIKYLLYRLNNKIIKKQLSDEKCDNLSNLHLEYGCIPFDQMPFNSSLKNHNPKLLDLFDCINPTGREHELLARQIKNNTEIKGQLYSPQKDISNFTNIDELIHKYNATLYYKHGDRRLESYKNHLYIKGYESDTYNIIKELKLLSNDGGIDNYSNSVTAWLDSSSYHIDCEEKKEYLISMFENSKVSLIYGSAGTGKSTLINHISHFFNDKEKLYLANTNPAVDNLKRKVNAANSTFKTITKFLFSRDTDYDLLFIDECSTVSNADMRALLNKAKFKLLVLVGDVFQIESILFGNWFNIARTIVPKSAVFELTKPYRSNNNNLLELWSKVRNIDDNILEHIARNNYSIILNESIFEHSEEDEIILCLNYDGLYGINNINRFLQSSNKSKLEQWGIQTYKVNDPILFNENERFAPLIYNNLKGKIINIEKSEEKIMFSIEIDNVINEFDAEGYDFELIGNADNGHSIIAFAVNKYKSSDDDDDDSSDTIVPFQIAYAVSIHKAQGLEYNSVKVIITDEIEEMITHNIFYTAITRAKEKLKIYWTPETENKVLQSMEKKFNNKDVSLLRSKFQL